MTQKPMDVTNMEEGQTAQLDSMMTDIYLKNAKIRYVIDKRDIPGGDPIDPNLIPTVDTVQQNELVVYDDGIGVKRLYLITGRGNLGYITLT